MRIHSLVSNYLDFAAQHSLSVKAVVESFTEWRDPVEQPIPLDKDVMAIVLPIGSCEPHLVVRQFVCLPDSYGSFTDYQVEPYYFRVLAWLPTPKWVATADLNEGMD